MAETIAGGRSLFVRVEGRVQGVGYRAFAQTEAGRLGVSGWVVNREDGAVELALFGPGAALADLVGLLRKGPPDAEVANLNLQSTDRQRVDEVPAGGHAF